MSERYPPTSTSRLSFEGPLENLGLLHDINQDKNQSEIFPSEEGMIWFGHSPKERNRYAFAIDNIESPVRQLFDVTIYGPQKHAILHAYTALKDSIGLPEEAGLDWLAFQKDTGMSVPTKEELEQFIQVFSDYIQFLEFESYENG